jgi:hypothetical protein
MNVEILTIDTYKSDIEFTCCLTYRLQGIEIIYTVRSTSEDATISAVFGLFNRLSIDCNTEVYLNEDLNYSKSRLEELINSNSPVLIKYINQILNYMGN